MLQTFIVLLVIIIIVLFFIWLLICKGKGTSCQCKTTADTSPKESEEVTETSRPSAMDKPEGEADDLKKINGIGPKLEQTLNELGIFHYKQLAEFTEDNITWVDDHLKFKGRIQRDNWIDQAKKLME